MGTRVPALGMWVKGVGMVGKEWMWSHRGWISRTCERTSEKGFLGSQPEILELLTVAVTGEGVYCKRARIV